MGHAIERFIDRANRDTISVFGGHFSVATISAHTITILGPYKNCFASEKDYYHAYKKNLVGIHYRSIDDSISYRKALLKEIGN